jgi:hypothetical protein
LAALAALSGCHVYLPLGTAEPRVGTRVSAELTDHGAGTLGAYVGAGVTTLRGAVIGAESADVVLSVCSATHNSGAETFWKGEQVRVPRDAIQRFQERRLSVGRSLLFGAAFLAGSVLAWGAFRGGISGGSGPSRGGGTVPR